MALLGGMNFAELMDFEDRHTVSIGGGAATSSLSSNLPAQEKRSVAATRLRKQAIRTARRKAAKKQAKRAR